jgi:hypothetical protein
VGLPPQFEEKLHPRGSGGKFSSKSKPEPPKTAPPHAAPGTTAKKAKAAPKIKAHPPGKGPKPIRYNAAEHQAKVAAAEGKTATKTPKPKKPKKLASDSLNIDAMAGSVADRFTQAQPWMHERGEAWYPDSLEWVDKTVEGTSFTREQGAAIVAAFSPNTAWNQNLVCAENFIKGREVKTLGDNIRRAQRVADMVNYHGEPITDPVDALPGSDPERALKITNFHRNILGDEQAVTVDRWAIRAALPIDSATAAKMLNQKGTYAKVAQAYQQAAEHLGVPPSTLQAIVWGQIRGGFD